MAKKINKPDSTPESGKADQTKTFDTEHIKTQEQQNYLNELDRKLQYFKSQGEAGEQLAKAFLAEETKTEQYKRSQIGYKQAIEGTMSWTASLDKKLKKEIKYNAWESRLSDGDFENVLVHLEMMRTACVENETSYAEIEDSLVQRNISFCFENYQLAFCRSASGSILNETNGTLELRGCDLGVSLLKKHFEYLSQAAKEKVTLSAIRKALILENSNSLEKRATEGKCVNYNIRNRYIVPTESIVSRGAEYLFSSRNVIESFVKKTLKTSKDQEYVCDILCQIAKCEFESNILPDGVKKFLQKRENIQLLISEKRLNKNQTYLSEILKLFEDLDIKISVEDAVAYQKIKVEKSYGDATKNERLFPAPENNFRNENEHIQAVIQTKSLDKAISEIIVKGTVDPEAIKKLRNIYSSREILSNLPKEYLQPEFVNKNIKSLSKLLDKEGINYLLSSVEIKEGKEKFHHDILKDNLRGNSEQVTNMIAKTDVKMSELIEEIPGYKIYSACKQLNILDENIVSQLSIWSFCYEEAKRQYDYSENIKEFISYILKKNDLKRVQGLAADFPYYASQMNEKQVGFVLTRVIEGATNEEDIKYFEKIFDSRNDEKVKLHLLVVYLRYMIKGELPEDREIKNIKELYVTIYKKLVSKQAFREIAPHNLPKILQDPVLPNMEKVLKIINKLNSSPKGSD